MRDAVAPRVAVHQLQNERTPEPAEAGPHDRGVFETMDRRDVWMVQRCEQLRLTLEPDEAVGISGEQFRQDLQGDVAVEPRITGALDLAHAAGAQQADDFVRTDARARLHARIV